MRELLRKPAAKRGLVLLSLLPFLGMCWAIYAEQLGPNPAENLIRSTGDWTLRFLCLTLLITPLRVHSN
ncbi:MAG: Sulfoxide reductase heme-binding subunit YedZ, partial [Pseudomonadota bacterium]